MCKFRRKKNAKCSSRIAFKQYLWLEQKSFLAFVQIYAKFSTCQRCARILRQWQKNEVHKCSLKKQILPPNWVFCKHDVQSSPFKDIGIIHRILKLALHICIYVLSFRFLEDNRTPFFPVMQTFTNLDKSFFIRSSSHYVVEIMPHCYWQTLW